MDGTHFQCLKRDETYVGHVRFQLFASSWNLSSGRCMLKFYLSAALRSEYWLIVDANLEECVKYDRCLAEMSVRLRKKWNCRFLIAMREEGGHSRTVWSKIMSLPSTLAPLDSFLYGG